MCLVPPLDHMCVCVCVLSLCVLPCGAGRAAQVGWCAVGLVRRLPVLLLRHGLLLAGPAAFVGFVVLLNGGHVVVGDHENHQVCDTTWKYGGKMGRGSWGGCGNGWVALGERC